MPATRARPLRSEIARAMRFDTVRYASVWEDVDLLRRGLRIGPESHVLSVTSAGDNVLGLLLEEPAQVTAVDLNPCQTALLRLKLAALQTLDHAGFAGLLGAPHPDRWGLYQACRAALPPADRAFWDRHRPDVEAGVGGAGRLDRYLRGWHEAVLYEHMPLDTVAALFEMESLAEQERVYRERFANPAFEAGFRWYFGEAMVAQNGRDPAQFAHAEEDAGTAFLARFRRAFTGLPLARNPYLERFMTGTVAPERALPYLRPEHFARLQALAPRVRPVTVELEALLERSAPGTFSAFNLSDVFEYASAAHTEALLRALHRAARPGARLAYWSLLTDRTRPPSLDALYRSHAAEAAALRREDRAWFYRSFHLEEARGAGTE